MKSYTMETALHYLEIMRNRRVEPNIKGEILVGKYILYSFKISFSVFVIILVFGVTFSSQFGVTQFIDNDPLFAAIKIAWYTLGLSVFYYPIIKNKKEKDIYKKSKSKDKKFSLFLGISTGILLEKNHNAAPLKNTKMVLSQEDAQKNILIEGSIGQGKTSLLMHSILLQFFNQKCGGIIFDIKANFKNAVDQAARATGRSYLTIGPGYTEMNLLEGLTPESAGGFIKSVLLLVGKANSDRIWVNTATDWCTAGLGMLQYDQDNYNLKGLYKYLFDNNFATEVEERIKDKYDKMSEKQQRECSAYSEYLQGIFSEARDDFIKDVKSTVAQVIGPFTNPELEDAFCKKGNIKIDQVLSNIILVDLPLEKWGVGAKTAYTFLKLRFFALMNNRQTYVKQFDKPVFMMCDEYQEIVSANPDGLSDLSFWDKSRSAKCIGCISWHGVSSLYAAIGDQTIANAIQQHFRQRICLLTEDRNTIERLNYLLGSAQVKKISKTESRNTGEKNDSRTHSAAESEQDKQIVDAQLVRGLKRNQAIATLNINGYAQDDVLEFTPIYVD